MRPNSIVFAILVCLSPALIAQQPSEALDEQSRMEDVHAIRLALERAVALLEELQKGRSLDALYRRIELSLAESAPLRDEARSLRSMLQFGAPDLAAAELELANLREEQSSLLTENETKLLRDRAAKLEDEIRRRRKSLGLAQARLAALDAELAAANAERADFVRTLDREIARLSR